MIARVLARRPGLLLKLVSLLLLRPSSSLASPLEARVVTPVCAVSSSITAPFDSTRAGSHLRPHDDRLDSTLAPSVLARRRAQAFDAQCWAVGAPLALAAGGALYAWTASADGRARDADMGALLALSGVVIGPAFGWARAGYWDRAASSIGLRTGTLVGSLLLAGAIAGGAGMSGETGLGVALIGGTVGLTGVAVESVLEVRHLGRHVRAHGPAGEAEIAFLTAHGPGLAVTLPLH